MIPINRVKIDSFRLLIPFSQVTILDPTLESKVVAKIHDTGLVEELDDQEVKSTIFKTITGISCRFAIQYRLNGFGTQEKVLAVIVNAKMLKKAYFNGIDKTNIHEAFKFINDAGIIQISKETFLDAKVVDTDFCADILLQDTTCKELVQTAYQLAVPRKDTQAPKWTGKENTGIQFGHRLGVGKSYQKKQFLKYYAKLVSLKYDGKNREFYETYLEDIIHEKTLFSDGEVVDSPFKDDNFIRMETTIKNAAHFATYGKEVKTLRDLLQLDIKTDYSYFRRPQAHYMTSFKIIKHSTELTSSDKVHIGFLRQFAKNLSMDIVSVVPFVVDSIHPLNSDEKDLKTKRQRLKKKFTELAILDKKTIAENKTKKDLQKMIEFENYNLIPKQ